MSARPGLVTPKLGAKRKLKDTLEVPDITQLELSPPSRKKSESKGIVLCWGTGDTGQLGLGDEILVRKKPAVVKKGDLEDENVVAVRAGGMHTVALTDSGRVYTWGCNDEGALGRKATCMEEECIPGLVTQITDRVIKVCAGDSHTAVLTQLGHVYCWGYYRDNSGPLLDEEEKKKDGGESTPRWKAVCVMNNSSDPVIDLGSGVDHSVAVTRQGQVWSWGCAEQGQLGRVARFMSVRGGRRGLDTVLAPKEIRFNKRKCPGKVIGVFCGAYHTFLKTNLGSCFVFGLNNYGQCGTGSLEDYYCPMPFKWAKDTKIVQIAGGLHHTLILDDAGHVYGFGRIHYGRLGLGKLGEDEDIKSPQKIEGLDEVEMIAAGGATSYALCGTGKAYVWGMSTNLQLGNGDDENDAWNPILLTGKQLEDSTLHLVGGGGQHSVALITREN